MYWGIFILKEYSSYDQKIVLFCGTHGEFSLALDAINRGEGCIDCGHARAGKEKRKTHEDFVKEIAHLGYEVLSQYVTSHTPITVKCPKHGEFTVRPYSLTNGHRCAKCTNFESKAEKELFAAIKQIYSSTKKLRSKVEDQLRPYIKRFEADIYVPELNKGIEFDGKYYHSFECMRLDKSKKKWSDDDIHNYHEIKDAHFASKGIQILHIKEEDWNIDKEVCIKRCLDFLSS